MIFSLRFLASILSDRDFEQPGAPIIKSGSLVFMQTKQVYKFYLRESLTAIGESQLNDSLEQRSDY